MGVHYEAMRPLSGSVSSTSRGNETNNTLGQHGYRARISALDLFDDPPLHRIHGPQVEHHRLPGSDDSAKPFRRHSRWATRGFSCSTPRTWLLGCRQGDSGPLRRLLKKPACDRRGEPLDADKANFDRRSSRSTKRRRVKPVIVHSPVNQGAPASVHRRALLTKMHVSRTTTGGYREELEIPRRRTRKDTGAGIRNRGNGRRTHECRWNSHQDKYTSRRTTFSARA